jgi:hypothetical protein
VVEENFIDFVKDMINDAPDRDGQSNA